ncbi:AMP-binding protein [Variovorax sp. J22P271]|uniref:AMP-binding protein n=1 Tax=Variovorax davisae TaxID=3053515 RepID=UPI002577955D|nr:AMP-binding protein [Variovorax sp. J22P271]MDM0032479.1 AMP-binding protein [Variovorax sp. J22P271]
MRTCCAAGSSKAVNGCRASTLSIRLSTCRAVRQRAASLADLGVGPGSIVGIVLEDSIEHVVMLYAVARAGAVILPMDCRWRDNEKQRLASHFEPAAVMVEPDAAFAGAPCIAAEQGLARRGRGHGSRA